MVDLLSSPLLFPQIRRVHSADVTVVVVLMRSDDMDYWTPPFSLDPHDRHLKIEAVPALVPGPVAPPWAVEHLSIIRLGEEWGRLGKTH